LPDEKDAEERYGLRRECPIDGGKAHDGRNCAGDGADDGVEGTDSLQRRVEENVAKEREEAERGGEDVHDQREIKGSCDGEEDAEQERLGWRDAASRQRTITRAGHQAIVPALDELIEHAGGGGGHGGSQQQVNQRQPAAPAGEGQVIADGGGGQHQHVHARLGERKQIGKARRHARGRDRCAEHE